MSAVITPHVDSTAHTSIHPLSVYAPHDESRSETQRVEAPAQPFRSKLTLGCLTGSGGRGSGVARHHDDQKNTSRACAPALRGFLRVAARGSDGQMDEQANTPVLPEAMSCAPIQAAGTPVERGYFQGSKGGKSGFHSRYFSNPEKDWGNETSSICQYSTC